MAKIVSHFSLQQFEVQMQEGFAQIQNENLENNEDEGGSGSCETSGDFQEKHSNVFGSNWPAFTPPNKN